MTKAMTKRSNSDVEIVPDRCPECGTKYWFSLDEERKWNELLLPAYLYNVIGLGGTGKTFLLNYVFWKLLHMRTVEYHIIWNGQYERVTGVVEKRKLIEGEEIVDRLVQTETCGPPHPRIYTITSMADMLRQIAEIMIDVQRNPRRVAIAVAIDEAPLTAAAGRAMTSITATGQGLLKVIHVSRKLLFLLFLSGWDETFLNKKLRSGIPSEEGIVQGLVRVVFSKSPETMGRIANGSYVDPMTKRVWTTRWNTRGYTLKQLVAVLPQVHGWGPSLEVVPKTPLCKPLDECNIGDTTYSTNMIGGLAQGDVGGNPLDIDRLLEGLTNVPPAKIGSRILEFLKGQEGESEVRPEDMPEKLIPSGEEPQTGPVKPFELPAAKQEIFPTARNVRRPPRGLDFVIKNPNVRHKTPQGSRLIEPTPKARDIYKKRYEDGVTIRQLAEQEAMSETAVKRLLRNLKSWFSEQETARQRKMGWS